jgi:subtilisin family serine protease
MPSRSALCFFASTLIVLAPDTLQAQKAQKFSRVSAPVPGEYITSFIEPTAGAAAARENSLAEGMALVRAHGGTVFATYSSCLLGVAARMSDAAAHALAADPRVELVEENSIATETGSGVETLDREGFYWGLDRVDQIYPTTYPTPPNMPLPTYAYNLDGSDAAGHPGAHVYILDGFVRASHVELQNRIYPGHNVYPDGRSETTVCDCVAPPPEGSWTDPHATFIAGIIAGNVSGIAKGVAVHPVRVKGCCGETSSALICQGADWITGYRENPAVATLSLVIGGRSDQLDTCFTNMIASGVVAVVSAADAPHDACLDSPANLAAAITVARTNSVDTRPSDPSHPDDKGANSAYGSCIDVFAPGQSVWSSTADSDGTYNMLSGNSFAVPYVAGMAALFRSQQPFVTAQNVQDYIIKNAIQYNGVHGVAAPGLVQNPGTASPNRLLYARWEQRWFLIGTENCYAEFGTSCYSHTWSPPCPARPVWMKSCSTQGSACWSILSSTTVEEYQCSGAN